MLIIIFLILVVIAFCGILLVVNNGQSIPQRNQITIVNSLDMRFRQVHQGSFLMGSSPSEPYRFIRRRDEETQHKVTLSSSFFLAETPVTQSQYEKVMGENPSVFKSYPLDKNPQNPVENISWFEAVKFCEILSNLPEEKIAGRTYRLPTEAEWEYACRAGTQSIFFFGTDLDRVHEYAWIADNSGDNMINSDKLVLSGRLNGDNFEPFMRENRCCTHPVGQKPPNPWGFFDMYGNVYEWCADGFDDYPQLAVVDPLQETAQAILDLQRSNKVLNLFFGEKDFHVKVARGGCYLYGPRYCRSASRNSFAAHTGYSDVGFRVVCECTSAGEEPASFGSK